MPTEIDMEVFLGDVLEEIGIMSEVNRDKIESVCALQEQIAGMRNKQVEILEGIYVSGQKKFTKDPDRKRKLLSVFSQLMCRFPKIYTTIGE